MEKLDESLRESGEWVLENEISERGSLVGRCGMIEIYERVYTRLMKMGKFNDKIKVVGGYDIYSMKDRSSRFNNTTLKVDAIKWARDYNKQTQREHIHRASKKLVEIKMAKGIIDKKVSKSKFDVGDFLVHPTATTAAHWYINTDNANTSGGF